MDSCSRLIGGIYRIVMNFIALQVIVLHFIVLYCIIMYFIVYFVLCCAMC